MSEESTIVERQSIAANMALGIENDGHSEHDKKLLKKAQVALYVHKDAESALAAAQGDAVDVFMHLGQLGETFGLPRPVRDRSGKIQRNPDGSLRMERRDDRSERRYNRYKDALRNAKRFIELREGFDKVPPEKRDDIRGELRELLLRDRGAVGKKFRDLPPEARNDAVDSVLNDPDIARYVRDELVMLQGKNLSMRQRKEYLEQVAARASLVDTRDQNDQLVAAATTNAQSADALLTAMRTPGPLIGGRASPPVLSPEQRGIQVAEAENEIKNIRVNIGLINLELARGGLGRDQLAAKLDERRALLEQITTLTRNNQALLPTVVGAEDSNLTRRQQEIALIRQRAGETVQELSSSSDIGDFEREREEEEETITSALEGVFSRAAYRKILTDFQTSLRVVGEQQPIVEGKFMEEVNKGIVNHLDNRRWRKKVLKRKKGFFGFLRKKQEDLVIDTAQVKQDSDILFKRGPEVLLRRVLRGVRIPEDGGFPRSLTTEQIDEMMDEKEFVEKWGEVVATQVMGRKQMFDGYKPTEIHYLINTGWGRKAIEEAYEKDEEYRRFVNTFEGMGAMNFNSQTYQEQFARWAAQFPGSLIFSSPYRWAADGGHIDKIVDRPRPELVPAAA